MREKEISFLIGAPKFSKLPYSSHKNRPKLKKKF
jgi:hypothetical protein